MDTYDRCKNAALAAGLTESHAVACEDRKYGCPDCPFAPRTLRAVHDASCREMGMSDAEVEADWAAFEVEYDAWLDELKAKQDAEDPRFGADAGRDEEPEDLEDEDDPEEPQEPDDGSFEDDEVPCFSEEMDGDAESALASAGMGTDEDYGKFDSGDEYFDETPLGHEYEGE